MKNIYAITVYAILSFSALILMFIYGYGNLSYPWNTMAFVSAGVLFLITLVIVGIKIFQKRDTAVNH